MFNNAQNMPECVLFDLDGTLVDTAPDLVSALNAVLKTEDLESMAFAEARAAASHGSVALLKLGFAEPEMDEALLRQRQRLFLDYYAANICVNSVLFPGMDLLLERLEAANIRWGVVTNKPSLLTLPLMEEMRLQERAQCIVSGDTLPVAKPDPKPLIYAAALCDVDPKQCFYIGDAERDMQAANAAEMFSLIAGYGYIGTEDDIHAWGAKGVLTQPLDLLEWLPALR